MTNKNKPEYLSEYTVENPHLHFYHDCRRREKSKEINGPLKWKLISSYDRIKTDLEQRSAMPAFKNHEPWDIVPIRRKDSTKSLTNLNFTATMPGSGHSRLSRSLVKTENSSISQTSSIESNDKL